MSNRRAMRSSLPSPGEGRVRVRWGKQRYQAHFRKSGWACPAAMSYEVRRYENIAPPIGNLRAHLVGYRGLPVDSLATVAGTGEYRPAHDIFPGRHAGRLLRRLLARAVGHAC